MVVMKLAPNSFVRTTTLVALVVLLVGRTAAYPSAENEEDNRSGKIFSLINIVKFPNDVCASTNNLNGTCYTADECTARGGIAGSSCGGGFGVCCTITLACGNSASENNTYLTQAATTALPTACQYTICKSDAAICRIKYDFKTLVLAPPVLGAAVAAAAVGATGGALGDCVDDTFSISGAKTSPPTICGTSTGQHMIVDVSTSGCNTVTVKLGAGSTTSRSWNIVVSQYTCSQDDLVGPAGCLQYHTADTGRIANFGVDTATAAAALGDSVTHLSNQAYDICIRRKSGNCYICYAESNAGTGATGSQGTFGLSTSNNAGRAESVVGMACSTDYILIPGSTSKAIADGTARAVQGVGRHCGRFFATTAAARAGVSVCTRAQPYTVTVNFDANEVIPLGGTATALLDEQGFFPAGIIGFDLTYTQHAMNC